MKYFVAREFLNGGYPVRNGNWLSQEFIALGCGGEVNIKEVGFGALGMSPISCDLLKGLESENLRIMPHLIKFNGFNEIVYDYQPTMKEQLFDEWGVFDGKYTDFLDWKEGTKLKNQDDWLATVVRVLPDGAVLTDAIDRRSLNWYPIFYLYKEGWRQVIDKSKLS